MVEPVSASGVMATVKRSAAETSDGDQDRKPTSRPEERASRSAFVGRITAFVIPAAIWFAPLNIEPPAQRALAVASFMIIAWMTEAFSFALTGFLGCYLFWTLGVADFSSAFSGFATETPWFCFGALLIGMMATKTGLARRLAYLIIERAGKTPARVLLGFTIVSFVLTFFVPSGAARVILMASVALGLMQAYGLSPGSNLGRGIFVVLTYSTTLFDKMMIAGSSTILARGLIEQGAQVRVLWSQWFIAFLPCTLINIFLIWRLALWLYPPEEQWGGDDASFLRHEIELMGAWSDAEKKSAFLLLAAVVLWVTDYWHHLSPAMIGLGVGLVAALPRVGVLSSEEVKKVNYLPVFFVAAATSMGAVLTQTRALDVLTGFMFAWMKPVLTSAHALAVVPFWTAFSYHIFIGSNVSMLSTSMPPLMNFALTHNFNPIAIGMIWTFAGGCKIFIYQSAVLIVGYSYGFFNGRDLFRFGICMTIIESVILILLVSFYWPLIGLG